MATTAHRYNIVNEQDLLTAGERLAAYVSNGRY
jgi:hypothetical protein